MTSRPDLIARQVCSPVKCDSVDHEVRGLLGQLGPYPSYQKSGLPWLDSVPTGWSSKRAKYFLHEVDERSVSGNEELLSVSHKTGVTPRSQKNITMFMAESYVGHKVCRAGDIVINTMWAWMAALGVSRQVGLVSPAYGVYRLKSGDSFEPQFLDHLLRTQAYASEYLCRSTGVNASRLRLYPDKFLEIPILCPPRDEQITILRFLDHADRSIRRAVRAKRKLIALLNEQKRVIIREAISKGLNDDVPCRGTGIPWIGDIPTHWTMSRVKGEFVCLNNRRVPLSGTVRGEMTNRSYDYYGASSVIDHVDDFIFDEDLLLIAEDGANLVLRNLPLAIIARGKFWVNNHAHVLRPRRGNLEFLGYMLESINYLPWISGAAQPKLTKDRLLSIPMAVPPPAEQEHIVKAIEERTARLSSTIDRAKKEVQYLLELRARLVSEVVTGKVDVRMIAANYPPLEGESDNPEGLLEDDDLADEPETEEVEA